MNVDRVVECVKRIVDKNRCPVCDKADGQRVRYPCGHTACDDCVIFAEDCSVCLTPPQAPASTKLDKVFTQRVQNASCLLKACQDYFNIDVYKRQRLSEQLKIEKELFPNCIQAPMKYENKRKSLMKSNKENRMSYFPGERVSSINENKMENTMNYVQQWLRKNQINLSRKPFTDLNVNHQVNKNISNQIISKGILDENNQYSPIKRSHVNRSHFKTILKNEPLSRKRKSVVTPEITSKKAKNIVHELKKISKSDKGTENDESGIFDDEEVILVDDSQYSAIDKDKEALLAVIEADKKANLNSTSFTLKTTDDIILPKQTLSDKLQSSNKLSTKVPFYKKSLLVETCKYCNDNKPIITQPKEIKITIENNSFITTVKVFNANDSTTELCKKSVPVQTTISDINEIKSLFCKEDTNVIELNSSFVERIPQSRAYDKNSDDLFAEEENVFEKALVEKKSLVIEDSDSEVDIENSGPLQVTADIHRSCNELEYGILTEVENQEQHTSRTRRAPRGYTPTSTDSSDKENFNPNRIKRNRPGKKKYKKK